MSAEKIMSENERNHKIFQTSKNTERKTLGRVDINVLINRVRLEKQKENKTNLVFFGLIILLVVIVGIILSF